MKFAYASEAACVAQDFLDKINDAVLFPAIALLAGIALLVFLWGGVQFIQNADDPSARQAGRGHMIYGIIGLLVMVSAFAILTIAANTFDLGIPDDEANCGAQRPTGAAGSSEGFNVFSRDNAAVPR